MYKLIKPKYFFVVLILIFTIKLTNAGNFENWTFVGGKTKIKSMDFSFHSANFFREGSDYFLNHTQLSLDFSSTKSVSFGVGYKQEYVHFPTNWRAEYRPMLHLYYRKNWGYLNFRDRSRWEFRLIEGELINRYRNQVQFSFSKFKHFTPYLSSEFSFYFNKLDYTRQRTILGAEIPIKSVNLNLFLGHQINKDIPEIWDTKILMGTGLSYSF